MSKTNLLIILFLTLFVFSCKIEKQPPNIVFILVDDLGWADVKCIYPESFYDTPNIDKMAESGVRFTNAYAANLDLVLQYTHTINKKNYGFGYRLRS